MKYRGFGKLEAEGWSDQDTVEGYVSAFARATEMAIEPMLMASGAKPGMRVLDLCCGHGAGAEALMRTGAKVTAMDFSHAMLLEARKRACAAEIIEGDAQSMPFADGQFDAVVCGFGIMHIPDQPRALCEVHRVLRPGGIFVMTVWCSPENSPAFHIVFGSIEAHSHPQTSLPPSPDFHRFAEPETAERLLSAVGFRSVRSTTIDCAFEVDHPEQFWEIFSRGTVRAKMLIDAQPVTNRDAIRRAMLDKLTDQFGAHSRIRVPAPAALITALA